MSYRQIAEIRLSTGDVLMAGSDALPVTAAARSAHVLLSVADGDARVRNGLRFESKALVHLPTLDIDADTIHRPVVSYYMYNGEVDVTIANDGPLPEAELNWLLEAVASDLKDDMARDYPDELARYTRYAGLYVLQNRIRQIEESVRRALADDHVSDDDYRALRLYPERLAKVERLASDVRETPDAEFAPRSVGVFDMPTPVIDNFFKHVDSTADDARNAITRLSGLLMSQQVVLSQKQSADAERFQRVITVVGAAILVPGLIAGIFGANVRVPGESRTAGFVAMLLFMLAGAVGSYAILRSVETDAWSPWREQPLFAWLGKHSEAQKLGSLFGVAILGVVAGIVVLGACR